MGDESKDVNVKRELCVWWGRWFRGFVLEGEQPSSITKCGQHRKIKQSWWSRDTTSDHARHTLDSGWLFFLAGYLPLCGYLHCVCTRKLPEQGPVMGELVHHGWARHLPGAPHPHLWMVPWEVLWVGRGGGRGGNMTAYPAWRGFLQSHPEWNSHCFCLNSSFRKQSKALCYGL